MLSSVLLCAAVACAPFEPELAYIQQDEEGTKSVRLVGSNGAGNTEAFGWLGNTQEGFAWLPDGTAMYVWAMESPGSSANYFLADLKDGPGACITCGQPDYAGWPIPSPDGAHVLVTVNAPEGAVLIIADHDGENPRTIELADVMLIGRQPDWSPDGRLIVFPGFGLRGDMDIFKLEVGSGMLTNLTVQYAGDDFFSPAWSPYGDQIALISSGGSTQVQVMNADGSSLQTIAPWHFYGELGDPSMVAPPRWSPDGRQLAFSTRANAGDFDVFVVNPDGKGLKNLSNHALGDDLSPVWSPDGSKIAFVTDRDADWEVYLMDASGMNQINLSRNPETADLAPAWRP